MAHLTNNRLRHCWLARTEAGMERRNNYTYFSTYYHK
jgi:hypothetical protein